MSKNKEQDEGGLMYQQLRKFINVIVSIVFSRFDGMTSSHFYLSKTTETLN